MEGANALTTAVTGGISMITSALTTVVNTIVENENLVRFIGIGIAFSVVAYVCRFIPKLKH